MRGTTDQDQAADVEAEAVHEEGAGVEVLEREAVDGEPLDRGAADRQARDPAVLDSEALASDRRHERMDKVAVLYGEITAATREFPRALAESDRHGDWAAEGFGCCADWLAWRIGVTRNTAADPTEPRARRRTRLADQPPGVQARPRCPLEPPGRGPSDTRRRGIGPEPMPGRVRCRGDGALPSFLGSSSG